MAFSLVELLVVLVVLMLVVGLLIPRFGKVRELARTDNCRENLRIIGWAFRSYPQDWRDFPTRRAADAGGTKELADTGLVFVHFRVLSNTLALAPKDFLCPADGEKVAATGFGKSFSDTNVSYFVGVDASKANPRSFLTGDRNLATKDQRLRLGSLGLFTMSKNSVLTWAGDLHRNRGNLGFSDGSSQTLDQAGLLQAIRASELTSNRLAIP